jgi:hypothetical protein
MLGSNQRPLPCEGRFKMSQLFANVHKVLQTRIFSLLRHRGCSPLFAWVGVLIGVRAGSAFSAVKKFSESQKLTGRGTITPAQSCLGYVVTSVAGKSSSRSE